MVSKSYLNRLENTFNRLKGKNITRDKIDKMDLKAFNRATGMKKKSVKSMQAEKRLIKLVWDNRKQVIKAHEKKRGITKKNDRNVVRKQMADKFKTHVKTTPSKQKKQKKKQKPKKWTDIKVNGSVHGKQVSFTIKSYDELKRFLDDLEGSSRNYSRLKKCIVTGATRDRKDLTIEDMKTIYNVYYNFDYGSRTGFFGRL